MRRSCLALRAGVLIGVTPMALVLHCGVPTTRPRVFVTETDELTVALDDAAQRWPGESRSALLVRLALEGHQAAGVEHDAEVRRRLSAIERWSGAFSGCYAPDYLERLREDWPE